jgi:hypothetical protein
VKNKPDWLIQMEQAATVALAEVLAEIEKEGEGEDEYNTSNNK